MPKTWPLVVMSIVGAGWAVSARRPAPSLPADPAQIPVEAQLSSTRLRADLDGDGRREVLRLVNALTGADAVEKGSEVALAVYSEDGKTLLWKRYVMQETGAPAHDGELTAADLDGDGGSELILSWDRSLVADRIDRWAEIYAVDDPRRPRRVWEGSWERDTRRDAATPQAEREWFQCDIDYGATRRLAGRAIVLLKKVRARGGVMLDPPQVSRSTVSLRLRSLAP
ncbi:MAG TPA: hypothetical protein ENK10_10055 [Acidobacteria bacterium]|nr:hypothetical protein [Acidobacteriota bacterium]